MAEFQRAFAASDLPPGGGLPVEINGRIVAIFNVAGVFHAIDNRCPHRGGSLVDGALSGSSVVCPLHRWNFDLSSGQNAAVPGITVERFPVEIRAGDIYVAVPAAGPASE